MAEKLTDSELRQQLIDYGEKSIGPITGTTRSLYVKKLNKLKASKRIPSKSPARTTASRKLVGLSSDESGNEQDKSKFKTNTRISKSATVRRRSQTTRSKSRDDEDNDSQSESGSSYGRRPLRPRRSKGSPSYTAQVPYSQNESTLATNEPSMLSFNGQTSLLNDEDSVDNAYRPSNSNAADYRYSRDTKFDFSDSDSESRNVPKSSFNLDSTFEKGKRDHSQYSSVKASASKSNHYKNDKNTFHDVDNIKRQGFKTEDDTIGVSQYVSMFVLFLAGVFLITIFLVYRNMLGSSGILNTVDLSDLICPPGDSKGKCFKEEDIQDTMQVAEHMWDRLTQRAGDVECGYVLGKADVSVKDLRSSLVIKMGRDKVFGEGGDRMNTAYELFLAMPQWKVRLLDSSGYATQDVNAVTSLISDSPRMSFWCRFTMSAVKVFNMIYYIIIVALVVGVVIGVLRWRWSRRTAETKEIYHLVERIIDILKSHSDACQHNKDLQPYVAIPHIRDMLIPLKDRKRKAAIWEKAVKFLSANESRVREETQKIAGEEFAVWRWLPVTRPSTNGKRCWQGQAFSPSLVAIPTTFLKIRAMFDPELEYGEDWHVYIQDAILDKAGPEVNIQHIAVDKKSTEGCVYVKCASRDDAGKVYMATHGWYFAGRLVTVKYIRSTRYYERFPDAEQATTNLIPSTEDKPSLSQPFHKSFLEMA